MVNTYKFQKVTWVDLESPTRDEVRALMKQYDIHPMAAEELLLPSTRSKVDRYDDFIYLILHLPVRRHSHKPHSGHKGTRQELDIIVGKNFIITARYDAIDALHKFAKTFEVNSVLSRNGLLGEHAGYAFYYMMREIYHALGDELDSVKDALDEIERSTFAGREQDMVFEISKMSREMLSFKHAVNLHHEVLDSFSQAAKPFFGDEYGHYTQALQGDYLKVEKAVHSLTEFLTEVRQTNNSLLETKQNKNITRLTTITVVFAILNIPLFLFAIDFKHVPIIGMPNDFWIFSGFVACLGLAITLALAHRKKL